MENNLYLENPTHLFLFSNEILLSKQDAQDRERGKFLPEVLYGWPLNDINFFHKLHFFKPQ